MKVAPSMPWDDDAAVTALDNEGAVYVAVSDEWFRGVWEPAPAQIMDADYTRDQQKHRLSGGLSQPRLGRGDRLTISGDEEEETELSEGEEEDDSELVGAGGGRGGRGKKKGRK